MQHDVSATDGAARSTVREERGQTLVEYALIIAVVSLGALTALGFLSGKIQSLFSKAGSSIEAVSVGGGAVTPPPPTPPGPGTTISAGNTTAFDNASGQYYPAGAVQVCSPGSGANLVACGLGGGTWAPTTEGLFANGFRSGSCSFTYTTGYGFGGTWSTLLFRVGGSGGADFISACR